MIITKISRLGTYVGVNPHFATLIDFLEKTGLENLTEGSIAIDGNRLFGNCFTYLADGQAGAFFETHQKYLDIHLVFGKRRSHGCYIAGKCKRYPRI